MSPPVCWRRLGHGRRFSVAPLAGLNRQAGYLFQADALFPWKTAIDNVAIGLETAGVAAEARMTARRTWLTRVGLGAFGARYPHMLSGGQRKRVGLAQVLIRDPKILLMDEPFGPLDAQTRQIMGNLLLDLWSADRKAVLFVTHDLEEAIALSDRVVIMSAGPAARIIGDWTVNAAASARHFRGEARSGLSRPASRDLAEAEGRSDQGLRADGRRVMDFSSFRTRTAPDPQSRCKRRLRSGFRVRRFAAPRNDGGGRRVIMNRITLIALQVLVAIVSVLIWHLLTTIPVDGKPLLPPFFFSTPLDVAERIVKWFSDGTIWRHLWITLVEAMLAFVIGSVGGVLVGFWFARQPRVAAVFDPYVKMVNALPRIVLAPIFTLWFGLGIWSKVALGVTLVFFIVFFNVYQGVKEVSPTVLANARMLGMNERQLMRHVYWPSALVLDVLLAAYLGRFRRGGRGGGRISRLRRGPRLHHPAGRDDVRYRRRFCRHVRAGGLCDRDRHHGHAGRAAAAGLAAGRGGNEGLTRFRNVAACSIVRAEMRPA